MSDINPILRDEEEIDLREYLKVMKKRKGTIIALFLVGVISAGFYALMQPKTYKATAMLAVLGAVVSDEQGKMEKFTQPVEFYVELAKNEQTAEEVIKELKLDEPPGKVTPDGFLGLIKIETKGGSPAFKIIATAGSSVTARDIANTLAKKILEVNYQLLNMEAGRTKDFLGEQLKIAEEEMKRAEERALKFGKEANLGVLNQEVSYAMSLRGQFEADYGNVLARIEATDGELKEVSKETQNQEKTYKLVRSLAEDTAFQQIVAKAASKDLAEILSVKMETEHVNPIYQNLKSRLTDLTISMASLKLSKTILEARMKENEEKLNHLRIELANKDLESARLGREVELAREKYRTFVRRQTFSKTTGEATIGRVSVAAWAITPREAQSSSKRKAVLIGGFLGLFGGVFLAFFREYLSKGTQITADKNTDVRR